MLRIAIYGKGGIGKSTTASNLSLALAGQGLLVRGKRGGPGRSQAQQQDRRRCQRRALQPVHSHIILQTSSNRGQSAANVSTRPAKAVHQARASASASLHTAQA